MSVFINKYQRLNEVSVARTFFTRYIWNLVIFLLNSHAVLVYIIRIYGARWKIVKGKKNMWNNDKRPSDKKAIWKFFSEFIKLNRLDDRRSIIHHHHHDHHRLCSWVYTGFNGLYVRFFFFSSQDVPRDAFKAIYLRHCVVLIAAFYFIK